MSEFEALAGRRVLVTGAGGFIGSVVVSKLLDAGCAVVAILRPASPGWRIDGVTGELEIVRSDLLGLDSNAADRIGPAEIVFHLAAVGMDPAQTDVDDVLRQNVLGTLRVLELAEGIGARRIVYSGSCHEYGAAVDATEDSLPRPTTDYGVSKAAGWILVESRARRAGMSAIGLRPFAVYGPRDASYRLIPSTVLKALRGEPLLLTGGEQQRDFVYVDDVADAFLAAGAVDDEVHGVFNVATGVGTTVRSVVEKIVEATGTPSVPEFGALPYRRSEMWRMTGNPDLASKRLNWSAATSLDDGLAKTVGWFRTWLSSMGSAVSQVN